LKELKICSQIREEAEAYKEGKVAGEAQAILESLFS
jgi:hypothetical protein